MTWVMVYSGQTGRELTLGVGDGELVLESENWRHDKVNTGRPAI
jgi:hypothetical protein